MTNWEMEQMFVFSVNKELNYAYDAVIKSFSWSMKALVPIHYNGMEKSNKKNVLKTFCFCVPQKKLC